jgi:hypothetical protein
MVIATGILSAGVTCIYLDRHVDQQPLFLKVLSPLTLSGVLIFSIPLFLSSSSSPSSSLYIYLLYIGCFLIGAGGFPLMPLVLEMGAAVTYPLSPGLSSGLMWMLAQAISVAIIILSGTILSTSAALALLVACLAFVSMLSMGYSGADRRHAFEVSVDGGDVTCEEQVVLSSFAETPITTVNVNENG